MALVGLSHVRNVPPNGAANFRGPPFLADRMVALVLQCFVRLSSVCRLYGMYCG